ncbi:MAG: aldehyde ferredoxin oxidoreductase C-terminal domain-containing protein, partial [Dehalococcoidales bacterium]|nr:aldehyde ferredoxin oxidoreductase C-terminal domain-containing protein [Dehalococcoidales bacterium]
MQSIYVGNILRIDLTGRRVTPEVIDEQTLRKYVGGTGVGARILYDEVPPGVEWNDPENRLIMATGPLAGTRMGGSGTFSVVTKGCLTNGATATQANGYWGAYLRFNGFMGLVFQGASDKWVYLYVHDGVAELRDAEHLRGLDTWETEAKIKQELGKSEREMSVFGIGPAGENLVKFAAIIGDKGHAAAHNGCGAVMGSKKLKAVAIARGKGTVPVHDKEQVSTLAKQIHEAVLNEKAGRQHFDWGTSMSFPNAVASGQLPIKNLTTSLLADFQPFLGTNYRKAFELTPSPCWACPMHHLYIMKVTSGKHAGYVGEEPEYECWAAWGPLTGQTDVNTAFMLSNEVDRLGFDTNEAGWIIAFVMDCYERGIIKKTDTDGLEMTWGNGEATLAMLRKIARREGFGNVLAEGIKRAAEQIGGEAVNHAVYIQKGHAPRGHDHRARWNEMLDYATSGAGTIETGTLVEIPPELGLKPMTDPFSPDQIPYMLAKFKSKRQFVDSLGVCMFTVGSNLTLLISIVNAATGWNMTLESVIAVGIRNANLLRAFNIRHGIGPEVEAPSVWYGSIPVDGPAKGRNVKPNWEHMLDVYYQHMGWDRKSG